MPDARLQRTRETLPDWYQFGDARRVPWRGSIPILYERYRRWTASTSFQWDFGRTIDEWYADADPLLARDITLTNRYAKDYAALPKIQIGETVRMRLPSLESQRTGEQPV